MSLNHFVFLILLLLTFLAVAETSEESTQDQAAQTEEEFNLMREFDSDSNGEVSKEEFMKYLGGLSEVQESFQDESWRESGELAFKVYDKDQSESLNESEFQIFENQMYALYEGEQGQQDWQGSQEETL